MLAAADAERCPASVVGVAFTLTGRGRWASRYQGLPTRHKRDRGSPVPSGPLPGRRACRTVALTNPELGTPHAKGPARTSCCCRPARTRSLRLLWSYSAPATELRRSNKKSGGVWRLLLLATSWSRYGNPDHGYCRNWSTRLSHKAGNALGRTRPTPRRAGSGTLLAGRSGCGAAALMFFDNRMVGAR